MNIYIFTVYKVYFQTKDRLYVVFLSDVLQTSAKFSNLTNASREPDHGYILFVLLLTLKAAESIERGMRIASRIPNPLCRHD